MKDIETIADLEIHVMKEYVQPAVIWIDKVTGMSQFAVARLLLILGILLSIKLIAGGIGKPAAAELTDLQWIIVFATYAFSSASVLAHMRRIARVKQEFERRAEYEELCGESRKRKNPELQENQSRVLWLIPYVTLFFLTHGAAFTDRLFAACAPLLFAYPALAFAACDNHYGINAAESSKKTLRFIVIVFAAAFYAGIACLFVRSYWR